MPGILQENRAYEIFVPALGRDVFMLVAFEGSEFVSNTFQFRADVISETKGIDCEALLRKPVVVEIKRDGGQPSRFIHGCFAQVRLTGKDTDPPIRYYYECTIVPWLWFLNLETDCRIFQNLDAKEIITKVFQEHKFTDFTFKLEGALPKREYTVQYRETSLNFISRLLEEEGIFYFFEHTEQKHQLILTNVNSVTAKCPVVDTMPYGLGTSNAAQGVIGEMQSSNTVHTGKLTIQDYNFELSNVNLLSTSSGKQLAEVYDYPGNYKKKDEGTRLVKLRLEEQEARLRTVSASTVSTSMIPGYRFTLTDHFDDKCNVEYLILEVSTSLRNNLMVTSSGDKSSARSSASFRAIPFSVPYRPPLVHKKPLIHGVQTAIVTGKSGEEIWTDKYGRVKVQFHWDRLGKKDENSSLFIRISNTWAGAQWGQIQIPRIGQEVIVSFIEGDPDRPIITGRVYNDQNMPPYTLPANQTQSGIKSRSTKGGGAADFNEFRFEDKKGSEEIYLHAQKDFVEFIENKHTTTVRDSDQTITLNKGNQKTTVEKGNRDIQVDMGNIKELVKMGNYNLEATAGKIGEKAAQEIKNEVVASTITVTPAMIELKIGASSIKMTAATIDIACGAAKISLNPGMIIEGAPLIKLN
jgi:type VI secretion system secreted protein VgrG